MPAQCPWTCAAPKLLSPWVAWIWTCRQVPSPTRGGKSLTGTGPAHCRGTAWVVVHGKVGSGKAA
jgi:hypothetical protein